MDFKDDNLEMVVDLPIGVDEDQIKMSASSTHNSFQLVVDVTGPFSPQQIEIVRVLCEAVNAKKINNQINLYHLN